MEKRYWYELSEGERNKLINEWENTAWYNGVVDANRISDLILRAIITNFFGIVCLVTGADSVEWLVPTLIGIVLEVLGIYTICTIILSKIKKGKRIYTEFKRWLLKTYNIEK